MANYYFLAPSLSPLKLGEKGDVSFEELIWRCQMNLTKKDQKKMTAFRRYIDLNNIRYLFLEESIDGRGNLSEKDLDESLLVKDTLPEYVFDFLDQYDSMAEKLRYFPGVFSLFFKEESENQEGFLKLYFAFEREWKLVMLAIRAKEQARGIVEELQFEDFSDPFVAQILAQKDGERYDPPEEYADLKEKYLSCGKDPWEQYKTIAKWRFDRIGGLVGKPLFSIDWILSYMAQLLIVEDWNELDEMKGKMILDAFVG